MAGRIHETPSDVAAEEGVVIVEGPDGVAVTLTPEAAEETSDRLFQESLNARGQRRDKKKEQR
jgi:hypothetical protein